MDKYIKLLLETETTVILPEFGAIVIEDKNKGTLMFNEYLKFNDGKLDNIIVAESNMDLQEAQNYIAKYVREIEATISKGETYSIFTLGDFIKTEDGHIEFKGNLNIAQADDASSVEKPTPSPAVENAPKKPKKETEKKLADEPKTSLPEEPTLDPVGIKDNIYIEKAEVEHKIANEKQKPVKKKKTKKVKTSNPDKKRKKGGVFIWIALVILLIFSGLAIYIGVNYDKVKEMMGWDQFDNIPELVSDASEEGKSIVEELAEDIPAETELTIEQGDLVEDEDIVDDIALKETVISEAVEEVKTVQDQPVKTPAPKPTTLSTSGNIHLIAGVFSEGSNAESLVNDLVKKGHRAQVVDVKNGKHYVSIASFNSVSEAESHIPSIESDAPGAWIYRK